MTENKPLKPENSFGGFFLDLNKMEKSLNEIIKQLAPQGEIKPGTCLNLDFSMKISPDGKITLENTGQKTANQLFSEPLVFVQDFPENFVVTAELHGVQEKGIQLSLLENKALELLALGEKSYYKKINFNSQVQGSFKKSFTYLIFETSLKHLPVVLF